MEISLLQFGIVVGIISGFLVGLVPLILGFLKRNRGFGVLGFVLCLIIGAFVGLLGALPIAGLFIWLILRKQPESFGGESDTEADV